MFDHVHVFDGPELTEWHACETCEGSGRDPDADPALDDVRFAACFDCGGEGGEAIAFAGTCSTCGVSEIDVAMSEALRMEAYDAVETTTRGEAPTA